MIELEWATSEIGLMKDGTCWLRRRHSVSGVRLVHAKRPRWGKVAVISHVDLHAREQFDE